MTAQNMYIKPPSGEQDALVLTLMCPSCETYRSFKFSATLLGISARKQSGMSVEVACDVCKKVMKVSLLWASDRPGLTHRNPVDSYDGEVISVTDSIPMLKEGKPNGRNYSTSSKREE